MRTSRTTRHGGQENTILLLNMSTSTLRAQILIRIRSRRTMSCHANVMTSLTGSKDVKLFEAMVQTLRNTYGNLMYFTYQNFFYSYTAVKVKHLLMNITTTLEGSQAIRSSESDQKTGSRPMSDYAGAYVLTPPLCSRQMSTALNTFRSPPLAPVSS